MSEARDWADLQSKKKRKLAEETNKSLKGETRAEIPQFGPDSRHGPDLVSPMWPYSRLLMWLWSGHIKLNQNKLV